MPNKIIDDISLAETRQRSRAYGTLLHEKAEAFDDETAAKNVNDYGLLDQWLAGSEPPERTHDHDSSLWTGTYVASQFYRWRTTGEEEALDNALKSLEGMLTLVPVTGHDPTFARTLRPHEGGTPPPDPGSFTQGAWFQGTAGYEDMDWRCCGNNDMYQGVVYSYVLALRFLPDDAEYDTYRDRIAENIVTLLENNADAQDGQFNEVNANGIAYLATGDGQYLTNYDTLFSPLLEAFVLAGNGLFYLWGITDWSGQHLETVTMLTLQHLVQELKDEGRRGIVKRGWLAGMRNTHTVRYVLWPIAAYSFGDPGPGYEDIFAEAMWGMREAVYPKDSLDVDRRVDPAWTASPIPSLFWKFDWMDGGRHQGLYGRPLFTRGTSSCFWTTSPLDVGGGPTPWRDSGADYLHAYWMARAYGLLTSND
ncbi:MAG: hypothetical protein M5R36_29975 [Deltaproteobacteria bacterium]|nr:hypothetical protein [Deltaproteobacteria bacterium]